MNFTGIRIMFPYNREEIEKGIYEPSLKRFKGDKQQFLKVFLTHFNLALLAIFVLSFTD